MYKLTKRMWDEVYIWGDVISSGFWMARPNLVDCSGVTFNNIKRIMRESELAKTLQPWEVSFPLTMYRTGWTHRKYDTWKVRYKRSRELCLFVTSWDAEDYAEVALDREYADAFNLCEIYSKAVPGRDYLLCFNGSHIASWDVAIMPVRGVYMPKLRDVDISQRSILDEAPLRSISL